MIKNNLIIKVSFGDELKQFERLVARAEKALRRLRPFLRGSRPAENKMLLPEEDK